MAGVAHIDIVPRRGRAFTPSLAEPTIGEMWDSFIEFKHLYIHPGGWWQPRPNDLTLNSGITITPRAIFLFNKILDTSGVVGASIVIVGENSLIDGFNNVLCSIAAPYEIYFESVKNRMYFAGANNPPKIWTGVAGSAGITSWGAAGPIGALAYQSFSVESPDTKVQVGVATVANGSSTVTKTSGTAFVTGSGWVGKTIKLDDGDHAIQSVTSGTVLVLADTYSGSGTTGVAFQVHYGARTWTVAPRYAYAYYNPTTGHITNVSPVLRLSEQAESNVAVYLSAIATNSTLNGYGYTKIVIFRTAADGSSLLPLKLPVGVGDSNGYLNNSGGPLSFHDEQGDEYLGQILGLKEAPFENDPPPNLKVIAYFDGRFWGIEQDRPWILRFSADATHDLGVPEECWPAGNFRQIPSADGYGTGLKVVGSILMAFTERYAYSVAPGDEGSYRLQRVSTRGFGVSQVGVSEHPGDSSEASSSAIYVGRDRKLWRHFPGGRVEEIGKAIQTYLDVGMGSTARCPYLTYIFMADQFWFLVLGVAASNSISGFTGYNVLLYDFDQEAWYDWGFWHLEDPTDLIGIPAGYVNAGDGRTYLGLPLQSLGQMHASYLAVGSPIALDHQAHLRTHQLDFGALETKKSLESVELSVSDSTEPFTVTAYFDGQFGTPYPLTKLDLTDTPRYKGFGTITYVLQQPKQWTTVTLDVYWPDKDLNNIYHATRLYRIRLYVTPESVKQAGGEP